MISQPVLNAVCDAVSIYSENFRPYVVYVGARTVYGFLTSFEQITGKRTPYITTAASHICETKLDIPDQAIEVKEISELVDASVKICRAFLAHETSKRLVTLASVAGRTYFQNAASTQSFFSMPQLAHLSRDDLLAHPILVLLYGFGLVRCTYFTLLAHATTNPEIKKSAADDFTATDLVAIQTYVYVAYDFLSLDQDLHTTDKNKTAQHDLIEYVCAMPALAHLLFVELPDNKVAFNPENN